MTIQREIFQNYLDKVGIAGTNEAVIAVHSSGTGRYESIAKLLMIAQSFPLEVEPEIHPALINRLNIQDENRPLFIRETSTGHGFSIAGLMHMLDKSQIRSEIEICGILPPEETMSGMGIEGLMYFQDQASSEFVNITGTRQRDIHAKNKNEAPADLVIYGFTERYLNPSLYYRDVLYNLSRGSVVVLAPSNSMYFNESYGIEVKALVNSPGEGIVEANIFTEKGSIFSEEDFRTLHTKLAVYAETHK